MGRIRDFPMNEMKEMNGMKMLNLNQTKCGFTLIRGFFPIDEMKTIKLTANPTATVTATATATAIAMKTLTFRILD